MLISNIDDVFNTIRTVIAKAFVIMQSFMQASKCPEAITDLPNLPNYPKIPEIDLISEHPELLLDVVFDNVPYGANVFDGAKF